MWLIIVAIVLFIFFLGIRIVRPTHRGLIERLGKYNRFASSGFNWIMPVIDKMYQVNITEQMVDAEPQEIITNDNLNAVVDAQVYFKVKDDELNVKNSQYNVNNVNFQIVNLARTTLRNIIGTLTLKSANSERGRINEDLHKILVGETTNWGIEVRSDCQLSQNHIKEHHRDIDSKICQQRTRKDQRGSPQNPGWRNDQLGDRSQIGLST